MTTTAFDLYQQRLGVEREAPSIDSLFRLHRAHIERVPYETTWIHLGERWDINPADSVKRIATHGRGGYCFHLNGALAALLTELGYHVTLHIGGVHRDRPEANELTNHLVLTVHDLPTDANPSGLWYVDVGLGDALHEPLPLIAGTYRQGPMEFVLTETHGGVGDWHLTHDSKGSFAGMSFLGAAAVIDDFLPRHFHLSTSPDSGFVRTITVQHRDRHTVTYLRGLTVTTIDSTSTTVAVITDRRAWFTLLADEFGLHLDGADAEAKERLWRSAVTAHEAHQAAAQPNSSGGRP